MAVEYTLERRDQDLNGEAIDYGHTPRLRAYIRRNAYDTQSYARVYSWTQEGWKDITFLPVDSLKVHPFSYRTPKDPEKESAWQEAMREDLDALLDRGRRFHGKEG